MLDSVVSTVSASQHDILKNIAALYTDGTFELDATYSTGKFYQHGVPAPSYKFDIAPQHDDVLQADCRDLPLQAGSIASAVLDLPFIHAAGKASVVGNRFADARSQHSLRALYLGALVEAYRVLRPKGVLVFKCQDIVESGRQIMNHCYVWQMATGLGFTELDLFVLAAGARLVGHNHHVQQHARKFHSYFWVFQKGPRR